MHNRGFLLPRSLARFPDGRWRMFFGHRDEVGRVSSYPCLDGTRSCHIIPAIEAGRTAVITGGASGIGLAAGKRFASLGLNVVLADLGGEKLTAAAAEIAGAAPNGMAAIRAVPTDVSRIEEVHALRDATMTAFGDIAVLMNNAAISPIGRPWDAYADWQRLLGVNLWGVINGVQAFAPTMIAAGKPARDHQYGFETRDHHAARPMPPTTSAKPA